MDTTLQSRVLSLKDRFHEGYGQILRIRDQERLLEKEEWLLVRVTLDEAKLAQAGYRSLTGFLSAEAARIGRDLPYAHCQGGAFYPLEKDGCYETIALRVPYLDEDDERVSFVSDLDFVVSIDYLDEGPAVHQRVLDAESAGFSCGGPAP